MRYFEIILESKIPSSTYGYWVSPEGAIIPVGYSQIHKEVLTDLEDLSMDAAIKMGWVRIISNNRDGTSRKRLEICAFFNAVTEKALREIREIAVNGGFHDFLADNEALMNDADGRFMRIYDSSVANLMEVLRNLIKPEASS